ncbi:hypothetical protein L2750_16370 [Shewanella submarina]|uniref:Uncharacterized protein n=1 Tax=Shewanella submarina TaxID=2016376 RepID=A0ABV7GC94_9GAMM|nr:hypothetical protein [Shewanella submarina]MCL1038705.1 hypothetical protein [Shewanella submarina]
MSDNKAIFFSLKQFFVMTGIVEKVNIPNRFSVWYDKEFDLELMLPDEKLVDHEQSELLLNEVIEKLADKRDFDVDSFRFRLLNRYSDFLQVRSSGERILHGSINFSEGLDALNGLYGIIKSAANRSIKTKGKRKAVNDYLAGVNMLAPQAGSFIYKVELQLQGESDSHGEASFEQNFSLSRYINANLAIALARVSKKINSNDINYPSKLLCSGIDSTFCSNFLGLFSNNSDRLEFNFDWSFTEELPDNVPNKIEFNYSDRQKIERIEKLLSNSRSKKYVDLPAYIEKYSWPIDDEKGRVYLKLNMDGKDFTCYIETDSELYETLKAEHAKKQVSITCDLLVTSGKKTAIDILKLYSIRLNKNLEIELDK